MRLRMYLPNSVTPSYLKYYVAISFSNLKIIFKSKKKKQRIKYKQVTYSNPVTLRVQGNDQSNCIEEPILWISVSAQH
jgi:hypothetical protein